MLRIFHRRGVEVEEVGDALGVVRELLAVGLIHERVEVLVGLQEIRWHSNILIVNVLRQSLRLTVRASSTNHPLLQQYGRPKGCRHNARSRQGVL